MANIFFHKHFKFVKLSINNTTFRAIIPKCKAPVQNKATQKFEQAIFCEVDCKSKNDYKIFSKLAKTWEYGACLKQSAQWKYANYVAQSYDKHGHYILKKKNGEILAICRTSNTSNNVQIDFLEAKPNSKYRFAGQMILSGIIKEAIKNGYEEVVVPTAIKGTGDFYMGACGFRENGTKSISEIDYVMRKKEMLNLIQNAPIQR